MDILIIDDAPIMIALLKKLVAKMPDCEAVAFTSAAEALTWCVSHDPDLVIVDESHRIRNPATRRYASVAALCAQQLAQASDYALGQIVEALGLVEAAEHRRPHQLADPPTAYCD